MIELVAVVNMHPVQLIPLANPRNRSMEATSANTQSLVWASSIIR